MGAVIGFMLGVIVGVTGLCMAALSRDSDEDREQDEFLENWRREHEDDGK